MTRLIAFNKPFNVLSQFTDKSTLASSRETLSDYMDVHVSIPLAGSTGIVRACYS